jgi:hypothetical protein
VAAGQTCVVTVPVRASMPGVHQNVLPAGAVRSSDTYNLAPAAATLQAIAVIPTLSTWVLLALAGTLAAVALLRVSS